MKKCLQGLLWLLLGLPFLAWGAADPLPAYYHDKIITSAIVNGTGEVCSGALVVWKNSYLSAQWLAASTSGAANVRVYVTASLDDSNSPNFAVPAGVGDLSASDTSEAWQIAGIYVPMVRQIKVCVKGVGANPADTVVDLWLALQP